MGTRRCVIPVAVLGLTIFAVGRVDAGLITQSVDVEGLSASGGGLTLSFNPFVPSLGTLTAVEFLFDLTGTGDATILGNHANQPKDFAYSLTQEVDVNGPDLALTLSDRGDRSGSLGPKGWGTFSVGTLLLDGLASPTALGGFVGGDSFQLSLSTDQRLALRGGPSYLISRDPGTINGSIVLTYDYDGPAPAAVLPNPEPAPLAAAAVLPNPEPSTLALAASGLVVLAGRGLRARRRGRRAAVA
jgi:hypothetical protein